MKNLKLCECGCGQSTNLSPRTDASRGLIKGQPYRFIAHHALRMHLGEGNRKHGQTETPEYAAYQHAKTRCNNPSRKDYADYGGRGIKFLFNSFEEFFATVNKRPSSKHSLDRFPNNDGNYEIGNVRWATGKEQGANKRNKRLEQFSNEQLLTECQRRKLNLLPLV